MGKSQNEELFWMKEEEFEPSGDGMSSFTAKIAIRNDLKKKLIKEYDIVEFMNHGRYFYALVETKDGKWTLQLLIDKQNGGIIEVSAKKRSF